MDEARMLVEVEVREGSTLQVMALDYGGAEGVAVSAPRASTL
jgi:hypothetical protein